MAYWRDAAILGHCCLSSGRGNTPVVDVRMDPSLRVAATVAGMVRFRARSCQVARGYTIKHLGGVLDMMPSRSNQDMSYFYGNPYTGISEPQYESEMKKGGIDSEERDKD
eukprot:scaffold60234_cov60-Attheya_sp.AAC.2